MEDGEGRLRGVHRVTAGGDEARDSATASKAGVAVLDVVVRVVKLGLEHTGVVVAVDLGHGVWDVCGGCQRRKRIEAVIKKWGKIMKWRLEG